MKLSTTSPDVKNEVELVHCLNKGNVAACKKSLRAASLTGLIFDAAVFEKWHRHQAVKRRRILRQT